MPARLSTHHIPDEGIRFTPGETVHVDQSSSQVLIIQDPAGAYEVLGCRPATEYAGSTPLLRVDLRRIDRSQVPRVAADPWSPGSR